MTIEYIIIRGCSGSGKSTYAKKHFPTFQHYEADMFFMKDGQYLFDASQLSRAHNWCQNAVKSALSEGLSVVCSNTFTTPREIRPYESISKELNIPMKVIRLCQQFKDIHNVPEAILEAQKKRFTDWPGELMLENY
jgi:predicted kinase